MCGRVRRESGRLAVASSRAVPFCHILPLYAPTDARTAGVAPSGLKVRAHSHSDGPALQGLFRPSVDRSGRCNDEHRYKAYRRHRTIELQHVRFLSQQMSRLDPEPLQLVADFFPRRIEL